MGSSSVYRWLTHACVLAALGLSVATGVAHASGITVTVTDREGLPVPDVAVFLEAQGADARVAPPGTTAVMDQVDQRFVPHILVVQTGTKVEFPNSDTVAHHVYSFSHPNHFKLPIYKGHAHAPVSFDENGIVILGCNIHDHMLAYIVVVDTPVFAKTNADGVAVLETGPGVPAQVSIWSPRFREDTELLSVTVEDATADNAVAFRLTGRLRPSHDNHTEALSWSEY